MAEIEHKLGQSGRIKKKEACTASNLSTLSASHLGRLVALEGSRDGRVGGGVQTALAPIIRTPAAKKRTKKMLANQRMGRKIAYANLINHKQ